MTTPPARLRPERRRSVAYIRVSTEEQASEGYSLAGQERQCRAYAVARDWPAVAEVYSDAGVSGATRERPALSKLLADAVGGTVARVLVTKLDRMGRRAADILAIEDELERAGVERVYIQDSIDTSTPVGRMLRTVLAAVAELERDLILERTRTGQLEKARKGDLYRSRPPFGYTYAPGNKHAGTPGRLEPHSTEAPVVQRIFTAIAGGTSAMALALQLTAEGVPTQRGAGSWRGSTLTRLIHRPEYTGTTYFGRYSTTPVEIPVPALVSPELAAAAQAALTRNHLQARRNARGEYLLGGKMLTCGYPDPDEPSVPCNRTMTGTSAHKGKEHSYRCHRQTVRGHRPIHSVRVHEVEGIVWDSLRALLLDPDTVLGGVEKAARALQDDQQAALADLETVRKGLEATDAAMRRLLDLYVAQADLDPAVYREKAAELQHRKVSLLDQEAALLAQKDAAMARALPLEGIREACATLARGLDDYTFGERRTLVRQLCRRIVATPTDVIVEGIIPELTRAVPLARGDIVTPRAWAWNGNAAGVGFALQAARPGVTPADGRGARAPPQERAEGYSRAAGLSAVSEPAQRYGGAVTACRTRL